MVPVKFVPEKEVQVSSIEDGIAQLESDFRVEHIETDLDELVLDTQGYLSHRGDRHPLTAWALESLSGAAGIPASFAREIPWDLLQHNFEQLKAKRSRPVVLAVGRDRTLVNVIGQRRPGYFPARSIDVLQSLQGLERQLQLHGLRIADRGIEVSFVDPQLGSLQPRVGDITAIGFRVTNSETDYEQLKAASFLLRLVCTNGAVLSNKWGSVAWSYDPRMSYKRSLASFFQQLQGLSLAVNRLGEAYQTMLRKNLTMPAFASLWRRVNRVVGPNHADSVLGIAEGDRKALLEAVRENGSGESSPHQETDTSYWQAHNAITERARGYDFRRWRQLERLGGSLLDDILTEART